MILLALTYLAGVLTILSPCILPMLPFVFARSQQSFLKSGLPLLAGMCLTFSIFSALAIVGGEWIAQANEVGRILALILLTVFGLSLLFPHLSEKLMAPLTRLGSKVGQGPQDQGVKSSFVIGIGTGLLWAPCAGPILGLVLTGAASQHNTGRSIALLFSYSLGAATSLAIALLAGGKVFKILKGFLGWDQVIKKALGVAVLLGVLAIVFNLDRTVLTQLSKADTASLENKLLNAFGAAKKPENAPTLTDLPNLTGAGIWINSHPLTLAELKGKVVVVDFWTYSCINCLRSLPYVEAWFEKYKNEGLVVIGVHAPEFAFEKNVRNVRDAVKDLKLTYPVAIDNEFKIWNSFYNDSWPAHYFFDGKGKLRHSHSGEGEYDASEKVIRDLLIENGKNLKEPGVIVQANGVQVAGSDYETSPETYIGSDRRENFLPSARSLLLNQWTLDGDWKTEPESATTVKGGAKIRMRFLARDVHLVLSSKAKLKFVVRIDGHAPVEHHGADIDIGGKGEIIGERLYQLIRIRGENPLKEHLIEIEFLDSGAAAYAFTFG